MGSAGTCINQQYVTVRNTTSCRIGYVHYTLTVGRPCLNLVVAGLLRLAFATRKCPIRCIRYIRCELAPQLFRDDLFEDGFPQIREQFVRRGSNEFFQPHTSRHHLFQEPWILWVREIKMQGQCFGRIPIPKRLTFPVPRDIIAFTRTNTPII